MKVIEKQIDNRTIKIMIISYRINKFPNLIISGGELYQLPVQIGKKSFGLKKLTKKFHQGKIIYLINSKRINVKTLKDNLTKVNDEYKISESLFCPF